METLKEAKKRAEKKNLLAALDQTNGNIRKASKLMGVSERHAHGLIHKHNIKVKKTKGDQT